MTDEPLHPAVSPGSEIGRLLDDVFDPERTERVADALLTRAFEALLDANPAATISAFLPTGVPVAVPGSIDAGDHPRVVHNGMDGLPDTDRDRIIATFFRAGSVGAARCVVSPVGVGGVTCHIVDLTAVHGVLVAVLVAGRELAAPGAADRVVAPRRPPRLATLRKDADAVIIGVDPALTEILGWEASEMLGHRATDFVHPEDRSLVIESWVRMRAGAPAMRLRQRIRRRDGTWVWFEVVNHDRLDDDAHPCVLGEMVDISEEMAAQEALREREQLLMRLAETIPVGLAQVDGAGSSSTPTSGSARSSARAPGRRSRTHCRRSCPTTATRWRPASPSCSPTAHRPTSRSRCAWAPAPAPALACGSPPSTSGR